MADADFDASMDTLGEPKAGTSEALDALAAYVSTFDTFPRSPYREADGGSTAAALLGRAIFEAHDCLDCHRGERLTDSALGVSHDVGTIGAGSGSRRGEALAGFDTPTLRGVWATAPYFHDGSAATLEDAIRHPGHGDAQGLTDEEMGNLVQFLRELENEPLGYSDEPPTPSEGACECRARTAAPSRPAVLGVVLVVALLARRTTRERARRDQRASTARQAAWSSAQSAIVS
jgi:cytochrome c peroxidase